MDAVVTDPPAGISFMGKHWDRDKGGRREWVTWLSSVMAEGLRVLKPGGYAFVWALPRTSHWTATALEDAGFEIRDVIVHVFGSGFPKSKALMKPASEHWILCRKPGPLRHLRIDECRVGLDRPRPVMVRTATIVAARAMAGESTGATPSGELTMTGRWPANFVMSHGPDCERVGTKRIKGDARQGGEGTRPGGFADIGADKGSAQPCGRLYGEAEVPAYRCAPGCPVALMDEQSGVRTSGVLAPHHNAKPSTGWSGGSRAGRIKGTFGGDTGTASRFFHCFEADPFVYQAKASRKDRGEGNKHPTVKSTALMRHLCRLIAAPGDLILDMFAGSGSTGVAAVAEGMRFIGIEQDAESVKTARRRLRAPRSAVPVTSPRRAAA